MASESRFGKWLEETFTKVTDLLNEQGWFQDLRTKWDELEPQTRRLTTILSSLGGALAVVLLIVMTLWSVYGKRYEYNAKLELITQLQSAAQEVSFLKQKFGGGNLSGTADGDSEKLDWKPYFTSSANGAEIITPGIEISDAKTVKPAKGESKSETEETLFEITARQVNIKQAVRFAFSLENGTRPVKIRNMEINTEGPDGFLNAKFYVSAFTLASKK